MADTNERPDVLPVAAETPGGSRTLADGDIATRPVATRRLVLAGAAGAIVADTALGRVALAQCSGITDRDAGAHADPARCGRQNVRQSGRSGITDSDPLPHGDQPGFGRGANAPRPQPQERRALTGVTDGDLGSNRDPVGNGRYGGRGPNPQTYLWPDGRVRPTPPPPSGVTDRDSGPNHDRPGYGRSGNVREAGRSGITDADPAPYGDQPGWGRGANAPRPQPRERRALTGVTDGDVGPNRDPVGNGRYGGRGPNPQTYLWPDGRVRPTPPPPSGVTDRDSGAHHDRPGYGRSGNVREAGRSNITDQDPMPHGDRPGWGRGANAPRPQPRTRQAQTGLTDTDRGPNQDLARHGRTGR